MSDIRLNGPRSATSTTSVRRLVASMSMAFLLALAVGNFGAAPALADSGSQCGSSAGNVSVCVSVTYKWITHTDSRGTFRWAAISQYSGKATRSSTGIILRKLVLREAANGRTSGTFLNYNRSWTADYPISGTSYGSPGYRPSTYSEIHYRTGQYRSVDVAIQWSRSGSSTIYTTSTRYYVPDL